MKRILVWCLIITVLSCSCSITAHATENSPQQPHINSSLYSYCSNSYTFAHTLDSNLGHLYPDGVIPIDFYICGLTADEKCTIEISSPISITYSLDTTKTYSSRDNQVVFTITVLDSCSMQTVDSMTFGEITIAAISTETSCTIKSISLSVLNSQYGIFVGYINDECLADYYIKWLFENSLITETDYDNALFAKTKGTKLGTAFQTQTTTTQSSGNCGVEPTATTSSKNKFYVNYTVSYANSGADIKVSGFAKWFDSNGVSHYARGVTVYLFEADPLSSSLIGTVTASNSGAFTFTFSKQLDPTENGAYDLRLCIEAVSPGIEIRDTAHNSRYSYNINLGDNITPRLTGSVTYEESNTSKAFQVHDALKVGYDYVRIMSGANPETVSVSFPTADSLGCFYGLGLLYIGNSWFSSWDVILHEYGHFVSDVNDIYPGVARSHGIGDNLIDSTGNKSVGCKLSWQEGWATYFALSAQAHQNVYLLNIPYAGDSTYQDIPSNVISEIENDAYNRHPGKGEGHEMAVARVLWDLADYSTTHGSISENFDNISLGFTTIWSYSINSKALDFSTFMNYYYLRQTKTSVNYRLAGAILADQNFTADSLDYYAFNLNSPVFSWTYPTGSTTVPNNYYIEVYDLSMNILYSVALTGSSNSYTPASSFWSTIRSNHSTGVYVCIKATPQGSYQTGSYYSEFLYCSTN